MPTYSYTCASCCQSIEAFQKISDEPLVSCPSCGQDTLKRGIGGGSVSFRFQGSGFYLTDYKKKGPLRVVLVEKTKKVAGEHLQPFLYPKYKSTPTTFLFRRNQGPRIVLSP